MLLDRLGSPPPALPLPDTAPDSSKSASCSCCGLESNSSFGEEGVFEERFDPAARGEMEEGRVAPPAVRCSRRGVPVDDHAGSH